MITNKNKYYRETKQRRRIVEILKSSEDHPNAHWLYEQMKHEFPNLSISTVYRNLRILKEQGRITSLPFGPAYDRFDGKMAPHQHAICQKCGKVVDIQLDALQELLKRAEKSSHYKIQGLRMTCYGYCEECYKRKEDEEPFSQNKVAEEY